MKINTAIKMKNILFIIIKLQCTKQVKIFRVAKFLSQINFKKSGNITDILY
jgi:hypothetical protein